MAKRLNVWLAVEELDDETGESRDLDEVKLLEVESREEAREVVQGLLDLYGSPYQLRLEEGGETSGEGEGLGG